MGFPAVLRATWSDVNADLEVRWHRRWAARGQSGAQRDLRPIGTPAGVATARACAWLEGWGGSKDPCRALIESCSVSREYRRLDHDAEPRDEPDAQTAALRLPFVRRLSQTLDGFSTERSSTSAAIYERT